MTTLGVVRVLEFEQPLYPPLLSARTHLLLSIQREREFFIGLLVQVHHIDTMFWLTGLAPWEF